MTLPADPVTSSRFPGPRESWRILLESERLRDVPRRPDAPETGCGRYTLYGCGRDTLQVMAKARLEHAKIGLRTHAAGAAAAHARYILRESACVAAVTRDEDGNRLTMTPADQLARLRTVASAWLSECERGAARKDERICDTLTLTFASDLGREERIDLLRAFCEDVTQGRLEYIAALHEREAHVILRDRDVVTNRRVLNTSDKGSTALLERAWRDVAKQIPSGSAAALFAERSLSIPDRKSGP